MNCSAMVDVICLFFSEHLSFDWWNAGSIVKYKFVGPFTMQGILFFCLEQTKEKKTMHVVNCFCFLCLSFFEERMS